MTPFKAPLSDILFSLNDVAGASVLPDWDAELATELGGHFAAFAEGEIAPLDENGDTEGAHLENGRVRMPAGFRDVYRSYAEQGWAGLTAPEEFGGQGLGGCMLAITSEIFSGANHSLQMVTGLVPGAIRTVMQFGTEDQKARFVPPLASGEWLSTMCLTEAGAGSDLSRVRCRGERDGDGWRLNGEKIFISGGDQDMSDGVFHLVLARTGDGGVKGLSLFACTSEVADGTRNAVTVTRIEEKMGLHASPTCQLAFDGAKAELIGAEGDGLRAMFTMMNHARLDVALQGVAHATRAHDIAARYAAERVQGRGPDGPVTLDQHADVRRMLDEMECLAIGGRAIAHSALVSLEQGDNPDLVEFLTPIAKVFCTEAGMRSADTGIQVLGGYGYLREYRVEQVWRDARITAIYEGANGIHAAQLATRGLRVGGGADAFQAFVSHIADAAEDPALKADLEAWDAARHAMVSSTGPLAAAHDFMALTGWVLFLAMWARIGAVADKSPNPSCARLAQVARTRMGPEVAASVARLRATLAADPT